MQPPPGTVRGAALWEKRTVLPGREAPKPDFFFVESIEELLWLKNAIIMKSWV